MNQNTDRYMNTPRTKLVI